MLREHGGVIHRLLAQQEQQYSEAPICLNRGSDSGGSCLYSAVVGFVFPSMELAQGRICTTECLPYALVRKDLARSCVLFQYFFVVDANKSAPLTVAYLIN